LIIYDILSIFQYQVSTTVMDLVVVFASFVFMLALLCFFDAVVFSVNKDLYKLHVSCPSLVHCPNIEQTYVYCTLSLLATFTQHRTFVRI